MYKIVIAFIFLILMMQSREVFAAPLSPEKEEVKLSKTAKNSLKLSDDLFKQGKYNEAIDYYKIVLEEDETNIHCLYNVAEAYRVQRYYSDAKNYYYQVIVNGGTSEYPMIRYWLGKMLKASEEYEAAKESFQKFLNSYQGEQAIYKERASQEILACDVAKELKLNPLNVEIKNAGSEINSDKSDFAPIQVSDDQIYFSGAHYVDGVNGVKVKGGGKGAYDSVPVLRVYTAAKDLNSWGEREIVDVPFKSEDGKHWIATPSFTADKKYMFLTIVADGVVGIYRSTTDGVKWTRPKLLAEPINGERIMSKHPYIFQDGDGVEHMLFSSNMDGGQGGFDLYISTLENGTPGEPKHLGNIVNTDLNEESPYYNPVTKTLYFSSDGHPGMGQLDVFYANGNLMEAAFDSVTNVGYPINTGTDDKFFIQYDSTQVGENWVSRGYISSNRAGGLAYKAGTCCDDIYSFSWTLPVRETIFPPFISVLYEDKGKTKVVGNARIEIIDPKTGEVLATLVTNGDGSYTIEGLKKEEGRIVNFNLRKRGYIPKSLPWDMGMSIDEANLDLFLERIDLPIVFYEFNRFNLINVEKEKLDKVAYYMKQMPETTMEVVSHTDNVGNNAYNLRLSERRCNFVLEYLVSKGIDIARLNGKWNGEEKPLVSNNSKLGRDHNRRSQFGMILDDELWAESGTSHLDFNMFDEDGELIASSDKDASVDETADARDELPTVAAKPEEDALAAQELKSQSGEKITGGLSFKVQIGAFSDPGLSRFENLSVASEIKIEQLNKVLYRFVVGDFSKIADAESYRQKMIAEGISDAWIVPYQNGQRISMVAAKQLVDQN